MFLYRPGESGQGPARCYKLYHVMNQLSRKGTMKFCRNWGWRRYEVKNEDKHMIYNGALKEKTIKKCLFCTDCVLRNAIKDGNESDRLERSEGLGALWYLYRPHNVLQINHFIRFTAYLYRFTFKHS